MGVGGWGESWYAIFRRVSESGLYGKPYYWYIQGYQEPFDSLDVLASLKLPFQARLRFA